MATATLTVTSGTGGTLAVDLRARTLPAPGTNGANLPLGYIAVGSGTPLRAAQSGAGATATAQAAASWKLQTDGTAPTGAQPAMNTIDLGLVTDAANGTVLYMDVYLAAVQGVSLAPSEFSVDYPFGVTLAAASVNTGPFTVTTTGGNSLFTVTCSTANPTSGLRVSLAFAAPTNPTYPVQVLPSNPDTDPKFMGLQGVAFYGPRQYLVAMSPGPYYTVPFVTGSSGSVLPSPVVVMPGVFDASPLTGLGADLYTLDANTPGDTAATQYFSATALLGGLSAPQWLGTYGFVPAWRPTGPAVVNMALVGFQTADPTGVVALTDTQLLSSPLDVLDCAGGAQTALGAMYVAADVTQAVLVVQPPATNLSTFANAGVANPGVTSVYSSPAFPAAPLGVFTITWGGVAFVTAVIAGFQNLVRVDGTYVSGTTAEPRAAYLPWGVGAPTARTVAAVSPTEAFVLPAEAAEDFEQTLTYVIYPEGGGAATVVPNLVTYPTIDDLSTTAVFTLPGGVSTVWWKKIGAALQVLVLTQTSSGVFTLDTSNSVTLGPSDSPVTHGPVLVNATATTALFAFVGNGAVKHVRLTVTVGVAATLGSVFTTPGLVGVPGTVTGLRPITFPANTVAGSNTTALALSVDASGALACWTSLLN